MSVASVPRNALGQPALPSKEYSESLSLLLRSHILHYEFPTEAFYVSPLGVIVNEELATTLWVSIKLIVQNVNLNADVIRFCTNHGLAPVPEIFTFPFHHGVNMLRVVHTTLPAARRQVALTQAAGRRALQWLIDLCRTIETDSVLTNPQLASHYYGLIDFYRCITTPSANAADNPCRALVPYHPPPPPPVPGNSVPYSPSQPQLGLPPTMVHLSSPDLVAQYQALLRQEGERQSGQNEQQTQQTVQEILNRLNDNMEGVSVEEIQ